MGRRIDMVYKLQPNEYIFMECGRLESNSTKELSNVMFKFPMYDNERHVQRHRQDCTLIS